MTKAEAIHKLAQGYTHCVVWAYDGDSHHQGDTVSCHKSDEAAQRKARQSTMWRPCDLREYAVQGEY